MIFYIYLINNGKWKHGDLNPNLILTKPIPPPSFLQYKTTAGNVDLLIHYYY